MSAPDRDAIIAGLREVADFLEAHPDLPVSRFWTLTVHTGDVDTGIANDDDDAGTAQVNAAAEVLGVEPTGTDHYRASRPFAGITYEVLRITAATMADWNERMRRARELGSEGGEKS